MYQVDRHANLLDNQLGVLTLDLSKTHRAERLNEYQAFTSN